jgi:hypothetical protein
MEVRVADAAEEELDLHVARTRIAAIEAIRSQGVAEWAASWVLSMEASFSVNSGHR